MNVYSISATSAKSAPGIDELLRVMHHLVATPDANPPR